METIIVKDVTEERGWFNLELVDDNRVPATKDKKLADAAFQSAGSEIQVEINHVKRGDFDNYYLNSIEGLEPSKPAPKANGTKSKPAAPKEYKQTGDDRQANIQAQWAIGRALETLVVANEDVSYPLDTETFQKVELQAQSFLALAKKLAAS